MEIEEIHQQLTRLEELLEQAFTREEAKDAEATSDPLDSGTSDWAGNP